MKQFIKYILPFLLFFSVLNANNKELIVVGEKFEFDIKVFGVRVGKQDTEVKGIEMKKGVECFHIWSKTYSLDMISHIYVLVDIYETWIACDTLQPIYVQREIHEGKWTDNITMDFDYDTKICTVYGKRAKNGKKISIEENNIELLSAIFFFRKLDLKNTKNISVKYIDPDPKYCQVLKFSLKEDDDYKLIVHSADKKKKKTVKTIMCEQKGGLGLRVFFAPEYFNIPVQVNIAIFTVGSWGTIDVYGSLEDYYRP